MFHGPPCQPKETSFSPAVFQCILVHGPCEGWRGAAPQAGAGRERSRSVLGLAGRSNMECFQVTHSPRWEQLLLFFFSFSLLPLHFFFFSFKCYWGKKSYECWLLEEFTFCVRLPVWWCICNYVDIVRGKISKHSCLECLKSKFMPGTPLNFRDFHR